MRYINKLRFLAYSNKNLYYFGAELVPVISKDRKPLMPTTPSRARRMIKSGNATYFYKQHIFCIRLNFDLINAEVQQVVLGIDPGSKKEGYTIKSETKTFLNIQSDAVTHVKNTIKVRREARKSRRQRNTPCRQPRWNRASLKKNRVPPSTKSRWNAKIRVIKWLSSIFPISDIVIEDISASSKEGMKKWNLSFSPLEVGKKYFYKELFSLQIDLHIKKGYETANFRKEYELSKTKNKLSSDFSAHCVDSWVLAQSLFNNKTNVDNKKVMEISFPRFHRRQLHMFTPIKGGKRKNYGGTRSLGFKRGSLVRHTKYGLSYVGGTDGERLSLHSINNGIRLCRNAKVDDCKFLTYNTFKVKGVGR